MPPVAHLDPRHRPQPSSRTLAREEDRITSDSQDDVHLKSHQRFVAHHSKPTPLLSIFRRIFQSRRRLSLYVGAAPADYLRVGMSGLEVLHVLARETRL